jgi:hypothetical protein
MAGHGRCSAVTSRYGKGGRMKLYRVVTLVFGALLLGWGSADAQTTINLSVDNTSRERWTGDGAGAQAGLWLDRGDVGASDTRRDLIVGSPGWSTDQGRVYVIFGGPVRRGTLSLTLGDVVLTGGAAGDRFGEATAAGYVTMSEASDPLTLRRDLVVGAPGADADAGAVYLFQRGLTHGQSLGPADAILTITGAPAGARLGAALATGDLNGDGFREIIAAAPGAGTIYVIRGGASLPAAIDLSTPSADFFAIQGSASDGVGRALAAGDMTGDGIYELAIGAYNEGGTGAVYVINGRASDTFPSVMNLPADANARYGGIDTGDQAGWSLDIGPFDADAFWDLIIAAPGGGGPSNTRAEAGEIYVIWGSDTPASRSLSAADLTIYGASAGHRHGTDLAMGNIARRATYDLVSLAPGASTAGELHVVLGRLRSRFGAVHDLAQVLPDRRFIGDAAAGAITSALVYDLTGEGFEDVLAGTPSVDGGAVYISFSPHFVDTHEPNDTSSTATTIAVGAAVNSHIFTSNDVDWFRFTTVYHSHVRITLAVPSEAAYALELRNSSAALLKTSNLPGNGTAQTIVTTLPPGTYFARVAGGMTFSQASSYALRVTTGFFSDAFEPNHQSSAAVTIGTLPYQAKIYSDEDVDWYRFNVTGTGAVTVALQVPASADLALALFTPEGSIVGSSNQAGAGAHETISQTLVGPAEYRIRVSSSAGSSTTLNYTLTVSGASVANPAIPNILLGLGPHAGEGGWFAVRSGSERSLVSMPWGQLPWPEYNATGGGLRLAAGDFDGDGADEIVVGLGPGSGGWVAILDDAANGHRLLKWIRLPWPLYNAANGEVFPAAGDLDGDGRAEIVLGLGPGGGGYFLVVDDATQGFKTIGWRQVSWAAYNEANGATHPAVGDLDGDGRAEIVLGMGQGSGGWVQVINGPQQGYSHRKWIQVDWPSYTSNSARGTTFPAVGDLDGDGRAEIVLGLGPGSGGWFQVVDDFTAGFSHLGWYQISWNAYSAHNGETRPAVGNIDGDGRMEIVVGLAEYPGAGGWFEVFDDASTGFSRRGWYSVGYTKFTANGGGLYPAILSRR